MATTNFIPAAWANAALNTLAQPIYWADNPYERSSHLVSKPIGRLELLTRKITVSAWQALTNLLQKRDWIEYDGDDQLAPVPDTHRSKRVYDETETEHQARIASLPKTVTISVTKKSTP